MKFHLDIDMSLNVDVDPKPELGVNAVPVALAGHRLALAYSEGAVMFGRGLTDGMNGEPLSDDAVLYTEGYGQGRKLREESGL